MKINVVTLCSGYDSMCLALERLKADYSDFDYELIAWSEIDKNACRAHDALFPQYADRNLGDMTDCDYSSIDVPIDLLIYSTPCTSVSLAGSRKGMQKGDNTASALIWHTERAIRALNPRYLLLENVRGMVTSRNTRDFAQWCALLQNLGYTQFSQILNAKDYGVAQNRERVFMVSVRNDIIPLHYEFPLPFKLERDVRDYLQRAEDVLPSDYIKQEFVTDRVLSDILDQPSVRKEMEELYHAEWRKRNTDTI